MLAPMVRNVLSHPLHVIWRKISQWPGSLSRRSPTPPRRPSRVNPAPHSIREMRLLVYRRPASDRLGPFPSMLLNRGIGGCSAVRVSDRGRPHLPGAC